MTISTFLDDMTRGYLEGALWTSIDPTQVTSPNARTLHDSGRELGDISPACWGRAREACQDFALTNWAEISQAMDDCGYAADTIGTMFYLARSTDIGFQDCAIPQCARLRESAQSYVRVDPYVGADGLIYFE